LPWPKLTRAKGGALASEAFIAFEDALKPAAEAGVAVVIQPGGSKSDDKIIAYAKQLGLAMIFTGERHFRH
jgi:phosphoribosylaminoimidazolecarboxamide formyltransferase/IMP cyclohydrolase